MLLGTELQWPNILVQLAAPNINFKKVDTSLALLQAAYQAGPPTADNSLLRKSHQSLHDILFGKQLIRLLREGLLRIRDNWESAQALSSFVILAARLLALTSSKEIEAQCLDVLSECRQIAADWTELMRQKYRETTDPDQRTDYMLRTFEISQICTYTFTMDKRHLEGVLKDPVASKLLITCAITVQQTTWSAFDSNNYIHRMCLQRWKRLIFRMLPQLLEEITEVRSSCLDDAIVQVWQSYLPGGGGWKQALEGKGPWLTTTSFAGGSRGGSQTVHYNLLTAELLVDGSPLSRLPAIYEENPRYRVLFGRSTLDVVPTAMQGMQFSAMKLHHNYAIYFGLSSIASKAHSQPDLLVLGTSGAESLLLIPNRLLQNHLPQHFVDAYIHWYHMGKNIIEFRPINDPWTSVQNPWVLTKIREGWILHRMNEKVSLVSLESTTGKEITRLFHKIELAAYLHITWHEAVGIVQIELPRLHLVFTVETETTVRVLSREYRGMYLDEKTGLGTLSGLRSKIVLINDQGERLVLVPNGQIKWNCTEDDFVDVFVSEGTAQKVIAFSVDTCLGMLVGNGDLYSMLFQCCLHALTTYCLPDRLTRKTGTEQALEIIRSAAVRSFSQLKQDDVVLLRLIAELTPRRDFYPPHLTEMQRISWVDGLSPIAQHCDLYRGAKAILQQAASFEFFHQTKLKGLTDLDRGKECLLVRDAIRSSTFHRSGFGAEHFTVHHDSIYTMRQSSVAAKQPCRSQTAFQVASGLFNGLQSTQNQVQGGLADHIFQLLDVKVIMESPRNKLDEYVLAFDTSYLQSWKENLTKHWLQIHKALQQKDSHGGAKPNYTMFVSTLAFAADVDIQAVQLLVLLNNVPALRTMAVPNVDALDLANGYEITFQNVKEVLQRFLVPFCEPSDSKLRPRLSETLGEARSRLQKEFETTQKSVLDECAEQLAIQWPCESPHEPNRHEARNYVYLNKSMVDIRRLFKSCWQNLEFFQYLKRIEDIVQQLSRDTLPGSMLKANMPERPQPQQVRPYITDKDLLSTEPPIIRYSLPVLQLAYSGVYKESIPESQKSVKRVSSLVDRLEKRVSHQHEWDYVTDLRQSLAGLKAQRRSNHTINSSPALQSQLEQYRKQCKEHVDRVWDALVFAVRTVLSLSALSDIPCGDVLRCNSPQISPVFFLRHLSRKQWLELNPGWKTAIVEYGLALTSLQRAQRLLAVCDNPLDLAKELDNIGHSNWQPMDYPESLLLEIENKILIREVQEDIARQMRDPAQGENSVVQLQMGEGKSFVIVPVVAVALADGRRLIRVIVAKPQSRQMHQILVTRLGGLCNRQIYHMPVSRSLRLGVDEARLIGVTYRRCMEEGGVMLVQPEHILSFKLMGVENVLLGRLDIARPILETQHFFDNHSRDIVDESDENFSVKFELIYTMGTQRPIELAPDRWTLVQQLLNIVARLVLEVHNLFPRDVEIERGAPAGSFPRLRLLSEHAAEFMKCRVAREICDSSLPGFPVSRQAGPLRDSVYKYITQPLLTDREVAEVESNANFWTDLTKGSTLLIRGLLAGGVLNFALSHKRWRVNYGRDVNREPPTRLAVPFRAKDSPTLRSEFSHPEVVVVLTCLSYYYDGMDDEELFLAFEYLIRSDHADSEYALWVRDCVTLPEGYRSLTGINLNDRIQCTEAVFPHLRRVKAAIDYFLSKIVFSRELREFPYKLSVSGWDIGQRKQEPTTAFSGTNDSKHLLPSAMKYRSLDKQKHTNALVLQYLLQSENIVQLMPTRSAVPELDDAERFLRLVTGAGTETNRSIEVIIDVGSQILELSNIAVAKRWLELTTNDNTKAEKHAVVFFDDNDELSVINRKGLVEPLQTSPFARQLDSCLVFLDEAHTRGTDLRLPEHYRAGVTLGANLTKDRLVQGMSPSSGPRAHLYVRKSNDCC